MRTSLIMLSFVVGCVVEPTGAVPVQRTENSLPEAGVDADTDDDAAEDTGSEPETAGKPPPQCSSNDDCDDEVGCTINLCGEDGLCRYLPNQKWCNDDDECTIDTCNEQGGAFGGCGHKPRVCDDGNPCTLDECPDPAGCTHVTSGAACDDGNACTNDLCDPAGGCVFLPVVCDDGVMNTLDGCTPAGGCYHTTIECDAASPCPEPDPCQIVACQFGQCIGQPKVCTDNTDCTFDACQGGKCVFVPKPYACPEDGNPCTVEVCGPLGCTANPIECDDGKPYTDDWCDPAGGCQHQPIDGWCDTANQCEVGDACTVAVCLPNNTCTYVPKDCDDGIGCTVDKCDANGYCYSEPKDELCPNGQKCNPNVGSCAQCVAYSDCDDGDKCTVVSCLDGACQYNPSQCAGNEVCDPQTGWCELPTDWCEEDWQCSGKKEPCTKYKCQEGKCVSLDVSCDDGNHCTTDVCDTQLGWCTHEWIKCDDSDKCTNDWCDKDKGCQYEVWNTLCIDCATDNDCPTSLICEGLKAVQYTGVCKQYGCEHSEYTCFGSQCSEPMCADGSGCVYLDKCDDSNKCTSDSCDNEGCMHTPIPDCAP